jgi:hypothetical protein
MDTGSSPPPFGTKREMTASPAPGVVRGTLNLFAALFDGDIRQAYDGHAREAGGVVHFHHHAIQADYSSEGTKIAPAFSGSKLAGQIVFLVYFAPLKSGSLVYANVPRFAPPILASLTSASFKSAPVRLA